MDQEDIMFYKNQDKSYTITDLYLRHNISFGYKDSYNYDIDVDKMLLLKKSNREYFNRYNDVNKRKIVPLQLKINNFSLSELHMFTSDITLVPIESNDEEFFIKYIEIWDKINELIGKYNPRDFVETYDDDDDDDDNDDDDKDEFIMLEVEKNTSAVRDKYRNDLVFVFTSVFNNALQASLVQYRY